jgi:hypothetical protein
MSALGFNEVAAQTAAIYGARDLTEASRFC